MIRKILFALLLLVCGSAAQAVPTCTPSSGGISFGLFVGSQISNIGTITLTCTGTGKSNYTLSLSTGSSATYTPRTMKNGTNSLSYNLFKDAAYTQIWGDGTGGSTAFTGTADMKGAPTITINVTLYGRIPAQTAPPPGTYTDTIIASLRVGKNAVTTTSFPITATIQAACSISATNLAFGSYTGAALNGQSQISLTCTNGLPWNVGLNAGTFPGATVTTRRMTGPGTSSMAYSLYRDAARTLNWGNTVGTNTLTGTGTGSAQTVNVYGRVPASQTLPTGGYQDTIIATVTF